MSGSTAWPPSSSRRRSSRPTSPTSTCRRRRRRPRATIGTEELPAEHLARLRDSDALLHVVRAFEDPAVPHPDGLGRPRRATSSGSTSSSSSPTSPMVERRLERLKATGRHGTPAEREANEREEVVLRRLDAGLAAGRRSATSELDPDEEKAIRGFRFLTQKPVLVLLNVGEGDIAREAQVVAGIADRLRPPACARRRALGEDRDGARRARARTRRPSSWRTSACTVPASTA